MPDPYVHPQTGVLDNKVDARTEEHLLAAEGRLLQLRLFEIADAELPDSGDTVELCAIHEFLFQDLYRWAGATRTVDIQANTKGSKPFLPASRLYHGRQYFDAELSNENWLADMDQQTFVQRLSKHYGELNFIHPFRDGNGRTQRLFWSRVANRAGYHLDWHKTNFEENNEASHASMTQDYSRLETMLSKIVSRNPNSIQAIVTGLLDFGGPEPKR